MEKKLSPIIVIAAPSGTGKTTLTRRLVKESPEISFSISMTTRPIREGEVHGKHYWYVSEKSFIEHVNHDDMIEWANVFDKDFFARIGNRSRRRGVSITRFTLLHMHAPGPGSTRCYRGLVFSETRASRGFSRRSS